MEHEFTQTNHQYIVLIAMIQFLFETCLTSVTNFPVARAIQRNEGCTR